jgi:hypothetical protein
MLLAKNIRLLSDASVNSFLKNVLKVIENVW